MIKQNRVTMASFLALIAIILLAPVMLSGCIVGGNQSPSKPPLARQVETLDYEKLYSLRTPYIGDAVKTAGIMRNLWYREWLSEGIRLETSEKPYTIIATYIVDDPREYATLQDRMLENAALVFALVENADHLVMDFTDKTSGHVHTFTREFVEDFLGKGSGEAPASSSSLFLKEFVPLLEKQDYSNIEEDVKLTKIQELYIWKGQEGEDAGKMFFRLLPGTNKGNLPEEIFKTEKAFGNLETVNEVLSGNTQARHLKIFHQKDITKEEMMAINQRIHFHGDARSISGF